MLIYVSKYDFIENNIIRYMNHIFKFLTWQIYTVFKCVSMNVYVNFYF